MLERQHLVILREVQRQGSLTAAAARLNLTQSALSHTIRRLEESHGIAIWTKQGRGLRLTQAGEYLLDLARRLLPQMEHAEQTLQDFATGRRGMLRVGMECHPCHDWLMRVTAPYLAAWPDVDLQLRTAFPFGGVEALRGYEIDLLVTPDPVEMPELRYWPVFDYELVLAVPAAHRLAGAERVQPEDFVAEDLITFPVGIERLDVYTRFLIPASCRPHRRSTIETVDLMLQLVAAGRGVSVVPDWLLAEKAAGLPIRALRLGARGLDKSIHLGVRRAEEDVGYIRGFLRQAQTTDRSVASGGDRGNS